MELLAINRQWAAFNPRGEERPFDAFAALRDLLAIRNYRQMVDFLKEHACNGRFILPCEDPDEEPWLDHLIDVWYEEDAEEACLQGSLDSVLAGELDVDLLGGLTFGDLKDAHTFGLQLSELMYLQSELRKVLTLAAVCNGADAPEGLFHEVPSGALRDRTLAGDCIEMLDSAPFTLGITEGTLALEDMRTLIIKEGDACAEAQGMFGDEWPDAPDSAFNARKMYAAFEDDEDEPGISVRAVLYPAMDGGVLYRVVSLKDCNPEFLPESFEPGEDGRVLAITFPEDVSSKEAQRLLAGRIVEALLNAGIDFANQERFAFGNAMVEDFKPYRFTPERGFEKCRLSYQGLWVEALLEEAVRLTLEGKVTLCTMCHTPVLIKDFRGKKIREVCSNACKTQLSRARREKAIAYAASGAPVEYAIEQIGEEYADSVRKWYAEAPAIAAPVAE